MPEPIPTRPARFRRRIAWSAGLGVLLLGAGFALGESAGWPWLAAPLERQLSQTLNRPLRLLPGQDQALRIRLLGQPQIEAGLLQVADAPEVQGGLGRPMLEVEQLRLRLRWSDLWRIALGRASTLHIEELSAESLRLQARRDARGRANWVLGAAQSPDTATPRDKLQLRFERLLLRQAEGSLIDAGQALAVDFRLQMDSPPPPGEPALQAQAQGRWRGQPFEARLQAASAMPLIDAASREPVALQLQMQADAGRLRFEGEAADLLSQRALRGKLEVQGPSLARLGRLFELTLPTTPPFQLEADLAHAQREPVGVWQLQLRQARIGGSDLDGQLRFDARPLAQGGRGHLSGQLHAKRMRLADLGPAVGAGTPPQAQGGRVLPQRAFDLPSLSAMDADVHLDIASLQLGGQLQPMQPLATRIRLQGGVLELEELEAGMAQGRLRGRMQLDARQGERAQWLAALQIDRLRLEQWLPPPASRSQPWASGRLAGSLELKGEGRSTAELLASADGQIRLLWSGGQLSHLAVEALGLDLAEGLGRMLRGDQALPVQCGAALLRVAEGRLRPAPLIVDTRDSTLWAEGQINLADERLDLRLRVAPKDGSLLSLRTPLQLRGSLAQPQAGVDGARLAGKLLPSVALGLLNPAAALLPLLDPGERDAATAAAADCERAARRVAGSQARAPSASSRS